MQKDPSKTEPATQKRRNKMRREGQVPKGQELPKAIVLLAGILYLRYFLFIYYEEMTYLFKWAFQEAPFIQITKESAYSLFIWVTKRITWMMLPFMLTLCFFSWLTQRLQVGKLWTTKPLKPKFGKVFNVMAGIQKMMISPQALIRLGKSVLQAAVISVAPYIVIKQEIANLVPLFYTDAAGLAMYILGVGYKMLCYAMIPMMLIAIADTWYTFWKYEEDIKMTKDEVKDERRQAEGDPQVKAQQQKKFFEFMAQRLQSEVPKADVIITNPTHYAVALKYNALEAPAPLIVAKGVDKIAEKIKEIAREHNIPIRENKTLAQALYKQCEIGDIIPEELFQAVASILASLDKFRVNR